MNAEDLVLIGVLRRIADRAFKFEEAVIVSHADFKRLMDLYDEQGAQLAQYRRVYETETVNDYSEYGAPVADSREAAED